MRGRSGRELQAWVEALERGEKVAPFQTGSLSVFIFLFLTPFVLAPVTLLLTEATGLFVFLFFVFWYLGLIPMVLVAVRVHQAERQALQLLVQEPILWDWRGDEQRIPYDEIQGIAVPHWLGNGAALRIRFRRDEEERSVLVPLHPAVRGRWEAVPDLASRTLADLIASRAKLVAESYPWGEQKLVWERKGTNSEPAPDTLDQ